MALRNDLSAGIKADLINYNSAIDQQGYLCLGDTTIGDSIARIYYYDAASSTTDDGENVLLATGMGVGRFKKLQAIVLPTTKRMEHYSGSTDSSGNYTVTFASSFVSAPEVIPNIVSSNPRDVVMITAISTAGFTVNVQRRSDTLGLLPSYANQVGVTVNVFVKEK